MKNKLMAFGQWATDHWLTIVVLMSVTMIFFLCAIIVSWLIGYWANALYEMKFELNSCWSGVSAVAAGIVTIVGLAKAAWTKYGLDSKYNSEEGVIPVIPAFGKIVNKVGDTNVGRPVSTVRE